MSSSCCGQGMTTLVSKFKSTSLSLPNLQTKSHPHEFKQPITTTQITPQTFSNSFTKRGFTKFTRPPKT